MVMVTTWVASQKLESSTARIISMVSPSVPRWWATMQGGEARGGGHGGAEALAVHPLQDEAQDHRAPAHEDGRGVEVGHRRAALQDDARGQAQGVDDGASEEQRVGGGAQQLGLPEPGQAEDDERHEVDRQAHVEGLGAIEDDLVVRVAQRAGLQGGHHVLHVGQGLVEAGRVVGDIGRVEAGEGHQGRVSTLACGHGAEAFAYALPGIGIATWERRQDAELGQLHQVLVAGGSIGITDGLEFPAEAG